MLDDRDASLAILKDGRGAEENLQHFVGRYKMLLSQTTGKGSDTCRDRMQILDCTRQLHGCYITNKVGKKKIIYNRSYIWLAFRLT